MALSARELLLIIRARDLASRELNSVSRGITTMGNTAASQGARLMGMSGLLTGLGIGFLTAGTAGLSFYNQAADAAQDYNQQAALTLTQVDQVGVSLDDLKEIGRDVAAAIPAPFEQMQGALFDIFSSMDVNVSEAERLLFGYSKASVAGQTDVQTAARATIAIMNGFQIPVEDVNKVLDLQFQLVRKGVGTYEEFAGVIGMVIPAAVRAGQDTETMAGALAFLTRNGLSASSAAAAAGRGFEAFANAKTIERLEEMGIKARDAEGNYLSIVEVFRQLRDRLKNMPGPERTKILTDLLKGSGGTIQARRFWDMAINNFDEFAQRVDEMQQSAGAMDNAYNIMFEQPQTQIQALKNKYEVLKTEIGDEVLPIKLKLVNMLLRLMDAWRGLDPEMRKFIIMAGLVVSVVAVLAGGFMLVVGGILGFLALLSFAGIGLLGFSGIVLGIIAVLAVLGAAAYWVYQNWDKIKPVMQDAWEAVKSTAEDAWQRVQPILDAIWRGLQRAADYVKRLYDQLRNDEDLWEDINQYATAAWNGVKAVAGAAFAIILEGIDLVRRNWDNVGPALIDVWEKLRAVGVGTWHAIYTAYSWMVDQSENRVEEIKGPWNSFKNWFKGIWESISNIVEDEWDTIEGFWEDSKPLEDLKMLWQDVKDKWDEMYPEIEAFVKRVELLLSGVMQIIGIGLAVLGAMIGAFLNTVEWLWSIWGDNIQSMLNRVWDGIVQIFGGAFGVIMGVFRVFINVFTGDWRGAWEGVKDIFEGIWNMIIGFAKVVWAILSTMVSGTVEATLNVMRRFVDWMQQKSQEAWSSFKNASIEEMSQLIAWIQELPGRIAAALMSIKTAVDTKSREIWEGLKHWAIVKSLELIAWVEELPGRIVTALGDLSQTLAQAGGDLIQGLIDGINNMIPGLSDVLRGITEMFPLEKGPPAKDAVLLYNNGQLIMQGLQKGIVDEIPKVKNLLGDITNNMPGMVNSEKAVLGPGPGAAGVVVQLSPGAVQITVGDGVDRKMVEEVVNEAFEELATMITKGGV